MADVLIVGGGVIGLSLAYELAGAGLKVQVVERSEPGREASWAGAGILPPAQTSPTDDPYERLLQLSNELHLRWSAELREQTGVDNGLRHCGGVYVRAMRLARLSCDKRRPAGETKAWRARNSMRLNSPGANHRLKEAPLRPTYARLGFCLMRCS